MELELRKKIQEAACLVLVPEEDGHKSRHASLARVCKITVRKHNKYMLSTCKIKMLLDYISLMF